MSVLTIRNIDDELKARLRLCAARNGVSMEAQVRAILAAALPTDESSVDNAGFGTRLHSLFRALADPGLELSERLVGRSLRSTR